MSYRTTRAVDCDGRRYPDHVTFPAVDHEVNAAVIAQLIGLGAIEKQPEVEQVAPPPPPPPPPESATGEPKPLSQRSKPQLLATAAADGVEIAAEAPRRDIVAAIEAKRAQASG